MQPLVIKNFQQSVVAYYKQFGRHDLPWRQLVSSQHYPYYVLVSELMLQQTQVSRVIPKYQQFIKTFPTLKSLAEADQAAVLKAWSGLGYNRRAQYLWRAAQIIIGDHDGDIPSSEIALTKLPGIGQNTAGAIMVYAFNAPTIFIETNIRTVYIHHFFASATAVSDRQIVEILTASLWPEPRLWYWALMDYGSNLKRQAGSNNQQHQNYIQQPVFVGSKRQLRGQIIKQLTRGDQTLAALQGRYADQRLLAVLNELTKEQLIRFSDQKYQL